MTSMLGVDTVTVGDVPHHSMGPDRLPMIAEAMAATTGIVVLGDSVWAEAVLPGGGGTWGGGVWSGRVHGLQSCGEEEYKQFALFLRIPMYAYTSSARFVFYARCPCDGRAYREGAETIKRQNTACNNVTSNNVKG